MESKREEFKSDKINSVPSVTKELLGELNYALGRSMGIPFYISPSFLVSSPEGFDVLGRLHEGFVMYSTSLAPYVHNFSEVTFSIASNGDDTLSAYIIDTDGNVESVVKVPKTAFAMVTLPLTPKSHTIYASAPKEYSDFEGVKIIIRLQKDNNSLLPDFQSLFEEFSSRLSRIEKLTNGFKDAYCLKET